MLYQAYLRRPHADHGMMAPTLDPIADAWGPDEATALARVPAAYQAANVVARPMPRHKAAQLAYEEDCRRMPRYPDGSPRKAWGELCAVRRSSWEREPTPRGGW